jgi:hypothetical protein
MEFLLRNIEYNEHLTYLLLGSLFIIMCLKQIYSYQFEEFLSVLTNGKYFILHNKRDKKKNLFNSLFYLFFTINISVFTYTILKSLKLNPKNDIEFLAYIFLFINGYFISKYLIEKIIFEILNLNSVFENYNFQKLTCINFISLFLFLANIIFLYVSPNLSEFWACISIGIFFSLYLISITIIILYNQKIFLKHWFYFILYLCALEIAPFLIGAILLQANL